MKAIHRSAFGVFAAVIVLFAALAVFVARRTSEMMTAEAERTVKGVVKETTLRIDWLMRSVETAVRNSAWTVGEHLEDPDYMYRITREIVGNNDFIVGSAVAFEPDFYRAKGRSFAPYSCTSTNGQMRSFPLPYEYHAQEWYAAAKSHGRARWCEPYFDEGGGGIMMCTYSAPLTNAEGAVYAVLTADISLDRMTESISAIRPYPQSYAVMISKSGKYLVLPPQGRTFERDEETITIRDETANGWIVSIVCPVENILSGARKLVTVVVVFAGVGLLIIILFSWFHSTRLQRETALRERMANELDIARQIQTAVVPKTFPDGVHAVLRPAQVVGGDVCDFVRRGDRTYFLVGDASGSGVPAVCFSFVSGMVFRAISKEGLDPGEMLGRINEALVLDNEQSLFMTAVVGVFDHATGELRFGCAGRNPLVAIGPDGATRALEAKCQSPLGVSAGTVYEAEAQKVGDGEKVLVFTDGIMRVENADRAAFGLERVLSFAARCGSASVAETAEGLLKAADDFAAGAEQPDDIAIVVLSR